MNLKIIVTGVLTIFQLGKGLGQPQMPEPKFIHITSEDGLPQNTILGIIKDKYGFIWFGTWGGLCRYDGYTIKTYKYDRFNNRSINNSQIHNLVKDANQDIWILTFEKNELCRYNYDTDDFERIPLKQASPVLVRSLNRAAHYRTVRYFSRGREWSINPVTYALTETDVKTQREKSYKTDLSNRWSLSDPYVTDIYLDDQNILWVGTYSNGINRANLNAKPFEYFYSSPINVNSIVDNNVRALSEDKSGNLWIGTRDKGISVIDKGTYRHISARDRNKPIPDNQIKSLFCDSRGITWIGTQRGLTSYEPRSGVFIQHSAPYLSNTSVFSAAEDRVGDVWFASWQGVYKYSASRKKLVHFSPHRTLKSDHARSILIDRSGLVWVGTEGGGVSILQPIAGKDSLAVKKHLSHRDLSRHSIIDNRVNYLYEDSDGFIWIGTGNGLDRYDPQRGLFNHTSKGPLSEIIVSGIIEDDNGFLWISHKRGIIKLDRRTFKFQQYTLEDGLQSNEFSNGAVLKSAFSNLLYFGGNNGYNAFNPDRISTESTIPKTVITELLILNHKVAINETINGKIVLRKPMYLTEEIELDDDDKGVAFQFAALHYSNPQENEYAYKLEGFDANWVKTNAANRIAKYSNLKAGSYVFKVMSSNSDGVWNRNPAMVRIRVHPPFWQSTWAYILYLCVLIGLFYVYHLYANKFSRLRAKLSFESQLHEKDNELHQSKLEFFTNISHELKTPLSLVLAPIDKLERQLSDKGFVSTELQVMKVNGDRLLKLLNQLLDFRKMETGHLKLSFRNQDLVAFVNSTIASFQSYAESKSIKLEPVNDPQSLYVSYDEEHLEKVLVNLLSNAFKFTPESGWIKVLVSTKETNITLAVTNFGRVIPTVEQGQIFKPFIQGLRNKVPGGTGLGLAYSKQIVELHGGYMTVVSHEAENGWGENCFTVTLPKRSEEYKTQEADSNPLSHHTDVTISQIPRPVKDEEPLTINGRPPVVLVVEDNDDLRSYLKSHLEKEYAVIEARNGNEGLQSAIDNMPDMILSDVMMPESDGLELCKRIKKNTLTDHIPVILLTAKALVEFQLEGMEMGADDYIVKPFNHDLLSLKIKNLLRSRIKMREKLRTRVMLPPLADAPESPDDKLFKKLLDSIDKHLSDPLLSIETLCAEVGSSRTQLYRKVRSLTGLAVAEFIKQIRLTRAEELLRNKKFNINEIAYMVGFAETDYFRKCFKAHFGMSPSEYSRKSAEENQ